MNSRVRFIERYGGKVFDFLYNNFEIGSRSRYKLADVDFPGEEERGENDGDSTSRMT